MKLLEKTLTSNEVAEMVGKRHADLIRDVRTYIGYLAEGKIALGDFFIESTYKDSNNQERPNYLLTKQGCEMVSNKLTGAKGVQFTAKYVSRFNEMETHIKEEIDLSGLSPQLQMFDLLGKALAKQEMATKEIESKVDSISDIVALNTLDWRKDTNSLINKVVRVQGGGEAHREVRNDIYKEVERRAAASLSTRLTNKRRRMADEGVCKSKRDKLNQVDVISDDKKLVEIYIAVVKDFAIRHKVDA